MVTVMAALVPWWVLLGSLVFGFLFWVVVVLLMVVVSVGVARVLHGWFAWFWLSGLDLGL